MQGVGQKLFADLNECSDVLLYNFYSFTCIYVPNIWMWHIEIAVDELLSFLIACVYNCNYTRNKKKKSREVEISHLDLFRWQKFSDETMLDTYSFHYFYFYYCNFFINIQLYIYLYFFTELFWDVEVSVTCRRQTRGEMKAC